MMSARNARREKGADAMGLRDEDQICLLRAFPGWEKQLGFHIPARDRGGDLWCHIVGRDTSMSCGRILFENVLTKRRERMRYGACLSNVLQAIVAVLPLVLSPP